MRFTLDPHVTVTETADGAVLLHGRTGRYWQVNGTAAEVLRCVLDGDTTEHAVADLQARYPEAADLVAGDVHRLLAALRDAELGS
jgi:hypothetical protein